MNQTILDAIDAAITNRTDSACPVPQNQWDYLNAQLAARIAGAQSTDVRWGFTYLQQLIAPWYDATSHTIKLKYIRVLRVIMKGLMA
jgi:hypothetical protein